MHFDPRSSNMLLFCHGVYSDKEETLKDSKVFCAKVSKTLSSRGEEDTGESQRRREARKGRALHVRQGRTRATRAAVTHKKKISALAEETHSRGTRPSC